jgi:hypothetical protein
MQRLTGLLTGIFFLILKPLSMYISGHFVCNNDNRLVDQSVLFYIPA